MRTTIRTWANGLALRIPKAMSEDLGMKAGAVVDLAIEDGRLVVTPRARRRARLKEMLARMTPENMPDEKEPFGKRVGREAW